MPKHAQTMSTSTVSWRDLSEDHATKAVLARQILFICGIAGTGQPYYALKLNRKAQEFNTGVNRTNLQQSNQENQLNLEQEAAYRTNKSKLLSQIGNDLGGVGKEEMLKMYPELMGLNYDYKGRHKSKNKKKRKKKEKTLRELR